jgi:hypothetical protein
LEESGYLGHYIQGFRRHHTGNWGCSNMLAI